jgi:hypothetical protein
MYRRVRPEYRAKHLRQRDKRPEGPQPRRRRANKHAAAVNKNAENDPSPFALQPAAAVGVVDVEALGAVAEPVEPVAPNAPVVCASTVGGTAMQAFFAPLTL